MKSDNEPLFWHSTLFCKHDSKPFEYSSSPVDTEGLERIMKKNQNRVLCGPKYSASHAAPLVSEINDDHEIWSTPELECTMTAADFTNGYEDEAQDSVSPCTIPSKKSELIGKNTDFYADKNVMQCQLPELTVCYGDDTYHAVKDICIDEGVPFKDKILIEGENKKLRSIASLDENENGSTTKERDRGDMTIMDGSKSSSHKDQNEDDAHESGIKEKEGDKLLSAEASKSLLEHLSGSDIGDDKPFVLLQTTEANFRATENIVDDSSKGEFLTFKNPLLRSYSKQKSLIDLLESSDNEAEQESLQIPCSTAKGESAANDLFFNSKVESATITTDFNSSKSAASGRANNPENVDHEQPVKIGSESRRLNSDNLEVGSEVQRGLGEPRFSVDDPSARLITFREPMAFSGSVSNRSDGSVTSTGSFAFPVLQSESEWNCSPVKMIKPDARIYQKRSSWKRGLFCCGL